VADLALNSRKEDVFSPIRDLTQGRGVDKVIECVGGDQDETLPQAVAAVKQGGLVTVVGSFAHNRATVPIIDFKFSEKSIIGSQGMPEGYDPVFALMAGGRLEVEPLITHRVPLDQAPHALDLMDRKAEEVMKVVLLPQT
jgi:threonine dehydrogenase-like Zn-dependent dehydrogenase